MRVWLSLLWLSLSGLAACGGGGGGGGGGVPPDFAPARPSGAGVAGLMEGNWRVASVAIVGDPRTRNPDTEMAWYQPDQVVRFRNGRVEEDQDPGQPGGTPGPSIPVDLEFLVNEVDDGLTVYGFGLQVGPNPFLGSGLTRLVALFGTTTATTAVAMVVQEEVYPEAFGGPIDRFMVTELQLVKASALPASLGDGELVAEDTEPTDASGLCAPEHWVRRFLTATVAALWRGR